MKEQEHPFSHARTHAHAHPYFFVYFPVYFALLNPEAFSTGGGEERKTRRGARFLSSRSKEMKGKGVEAHACSCVCVCVCGYDAVVPGEQVMYLNDGAHVQPLCNKLKRLGITCIFVAAKVSFIFFTRGETSERGGVWWSWGPLQSVPFARRLLLFITTTQPHDRPLSAGLAFSIAIRGRGARDF